MDFLRRLFTCKNTKEEKNENTEEANRIVLNLVNIGKEPDKC